MERFMEALYAITYLDKNKAAAIGLWVLIGSFLYRYILYPFAVSPLTKIPSAHWSCSTSPLWILWARYMNRENKTLHEAHQKCGSVVRVGPNEVSVNNMDAVKTIYQGGYDKHEWYSIFNNYGVPCTFSSQEAKYHSLRKRMVSNVYSKSYIHSSASLAAQGDTILNARLLSLIEHSTQRSQTSHGLDVHSLFAAVAMDFISAYCFGIRNSSNFIQQKAYRDHWLELYKVRKGFGFFDQELPWLARAVKHLGIDLTPSWVNAANKELEAWCKRLCDSALAFLDGSEQVSQSAADAVVLRSLLAAIEREKQSHGVASPLYSTIIRQQELSMASELFDHILAGQETTGVALTYLSWHLSQSLDLQRQLRKELLGLHPSMHIRGGHAAMPDPKQLDTLALLHAVILETIRRYAPAGGPEPRVTPSQSCRIGPYHLPGGVRISASVYNLHRDERYFPDPETWDYRRWLPSDAESDESRRERQRQFWGFSSGGRMCLGSNFAMHEMKLVVAAIYSNYTSHIVNDEGIEQTDGYTGHPKGGQLWLRFEKVS